MNSSANDVNIDVEQAEAFLRNRPGIEIEGVEMIGEGAWSRCFGFRRGATDLVIRFGKYAEDFRKDQHAHTYGGPTLPVPEVFEIGEAFDGYYAISSRVHGVPLESLSASRWAETIPAVAQALEAMRLTDLSETSGAGGWDADGTASHNGWSGFLLAVGDDTPDSRGYGWRERLAASPDGEAAFAWGLDRLEKMAADLDPIPRSLVHGDLINRNVLVTDRQLTGVLDWGCSLYGDHLYDLAWFEFWAPWYPQLDIPALRSELERRWRERAYAPANQDTRLTACYLRIGLDHLAYNANLGDWSALAAAADRMRALAIGRSPSCGFGV